MSVSSEEFEQMALDSDDLHAALVAAAFAATVTATGVLALAVGGVALIIKLVRR